MFWDNVAGVYDLFADIFNKETHKALIAAVSSRITPYDAVLECACGTGLLTGARAAGAFKHRVVWRDPRTSSTCSTSRTRPLPSSTASAAAAARSSSRPI